jgi:hypothetical protein
MVSLGIGTLLGTGARPGYRSRILGWRPAAYWPMADQAGPVAADAVGTLSAAVECLSDGGFEIAGEGGADLYACWTERLADGALADETTLVHGGSHAFKATAGPSATTWVLQVFPVTPGQTYTFSFYTRGDGANAGRWAVMDETHYVYLQTLTSTGVAGTTYALVTQDFTAPAGCTMMRLYLACPAGDGGSAYFDDASVVGRGRMDAALAAAGVTFGEPGIGDGLTSLYFSGDNTYAQMGTGFFDSIWDGDRGSAIAWGKVDAPWTGDTTFRYLFHVKAADDQTSYLVFGKHTDANAIFWRRRMDGGDTNEQFYVFATPPAGWFCMGYAWDVGVPNLRGYVYAPGEVAFAEVFNIPGLDMNSWGVHPANDFNTVLMAGSQSAQEWIGWGAHVAYWRGRALTAAEMRAVMVL